VEHIEAEGGADAIVIGSGIGGKVPPPPPAAPRGIVSSSTTTASSSVPPRDHGIV